MIGLKGKDDYSKIDLTLFKACFLDKRIFIPFDYSLMHYTNETTIHAPLDKVVALFDNPDNLEKWQPGFQGMEHISGTPGEPGAQSRLVYQMGKRRIEMIETLLENNLPESFKAAYDAKGVHNIVQVQFVPIDSTTTRYLSENTFEMKNLSMKIFGWLMPGAFKKQSQQYLDLFKAFAERETTGSSQQEEE